MFYKNDNKRHILTLKETTMPSKINLQILLNHTVIIKGIILIAFTLLNGISFCQSTDSTYIKLKNDTLQNIQKQISTLQEKVQLITTDLKQLQKKSKSYPLWKKGISGTIGFNISRFENWLSKNQSNTNANTISYTLNGFLNFEEKKYYWNNRMNLAQSWIRFEDKDKVEEVEGFQVASDNFNFNSLLAYKFSTTFAASTLLEYRTGLLATSFNNPGSLDYGVGASWKPEENLVFSIHPINYNVVFSDIDLISSLGLKAQANYSTKFNNGIGWSSNFSGFKSYKGKELDNWVWANSVNKSYKHLGIGFDISFKQSKQEAVARKLESSPFQWYYVFGLSYNY